MEDEVIIDDSNILDLKDQDLEGLETLLECEEFNIDTTPEPLDISSCEKELGSPKHENGLNHMHGEPVGTNEPLLNSKCEEYRICRCGNIIYRNHKSQYRCGACGCILY